MQYNYRRKHESAEETRRGGALVGLPLFSSVNSTASAGNTAVERSAMLSASSSHPNYI